MTTVGFGDLVPFSYIGRVIIMITSFWGGFLISLVIVSVSKIFELTRNQKKALHHLFLTRKAASSITSAMRFYMAKKRSKLHSNAHGLHSPGHHSPNRGIAHHSFASPGHPGRSDLNWTMDLEEELMISERVEA